MTTTNDHLLQKRESRANARGMDTWKKAGENLVKHRGGTFYLRAKVGGKIIRVSLETSDLRTAKRLRDLKLETLRKAASKEDKPNDIKTVGDALDLVAAKLTGHQELKEATTRYYSFILSALRATLPVSLAGSSWTADQAESWWKAYRTAHSAQFANVSLRTARKVGQALVTASILEANPAGKLKTCRIAKTTVTDLPSVQVMDDLITSVRSQRLRCSKEAAQMIEFLAWSGMRIAELRSVHWKDVGDQWITVTGGETGTKNHEIRRVPINPRLAAILKARRPEDGQDATGAVFTMESPRGALDGACKRLKIRHLRVHDLRHWFASHAIQSGVDIPTVARWLGHKDGGVLAMKTYGHIHDDHSLRSMEKMI